MERKSSQILVGFIVVLALTVGLCLIIRFDSGKVKITDATEYETSNKKVSLEEVTVVNGVLKVKGWAADIGETSVLFDMDVTLLDQDTHYICILPTNMVYRHDVTETYNDGNEYDCSGFESYVNANAVDLNGRNYELCILYDGKLVHTNQYLKEGRYVKN